MERRSLRDAGFYYINCRRSVERKKKFLETAKDAGIKSTRVACFEGRKLNDNMVCSLRDQGEVSARAELTPVEVAINYSHHKVWERFLRTKYKYCVVMEDDLYIYKRFIPNLIKTLDHLEQEGIKFSILHLWNGNWAKTKSKQKFVTRVNKSIVIKQETVPYNAGATCYVLTRDFAQYLVDHHFPIRYAVDLYIGGTVKRGRHLTIQTAKLRDTCIKTPFIYIECGGPYGTGASTTQQYEVPTVDEVDC